MDDRRQTLLLVTLGASLALMFVVFGGINIYDSFSARELTLKKETSKLKAHQLRLARGRKAAVQRAQWQNQSLPSKPSVARSLYLHWLSGLAEQFELGSPDVNSIGNTSMIRRSSGPYKLLSFQVKANGTLRQWIGFFYTFYSAGTLHKIKSVTMAAPPDDGLFDLDIVIEALIVAGVTRKDALSDVRPDRLSLPGVESYAKIILERNIFGPFNRPPSVQATKSLSVHLGDTLKASVEGRDRDKKQSLSYRLAEGAPAGARVSSSGSLTWTPSKTVEPGQYKMTIIVSDNGQPSRSAEQKITVTVKPAKPPREIVKRDPPPPGMEEGEFVTVIGLIESKGEREVWLKNKKTDKVEMLRIGDPYKVGRLELTITQLSRDQVQVEANGKQFVVSYGKSLKDARPVTQ